MASPEDRPVGSFVVSSPLADRAAGGNYNGVMPTLAPGVSRPVLSWPWMPHGSTATGSGSYGVAGSDPRVTPWWSKVNRCSVA